MRKIEIERDTDLGYLCDFDNENQSEEILNYENCQYIGVFMTNRTLLPFPMQ